MVSDQPTDKQAYFLLWSRSSRGNEPYYLVGSIVACPSLDTGLSTAARYWILERSIGLYRPEDYRPQPSLPTLSVCSAFRRPRVPPP
uniref:Uncharacterized protein n=1 Tax=Candidatus Kentrum sp. TC TaxID=2126339 RepID=A0A450YFC3_9GAMM|nr:MAG: hypothetical protein BECKTC1821D_GA0114238_100919 [Candidatus Kentron sp. TC]